MSTSLVNAVKKSIKNAPVQPTELDGTGLGENEDFLTHENHIFINKLNYICKNYDSSFRDVSFIYCLSKFISVLF